MKKLNNYFRAGIILVAIVQLCKHLIPGIPVFFLELGMGVGVGLELLGLYAMNHDLSKFRKRKLAFFKKITAFR